MHTDGGGDFHSAGMLVARTVGLSSFLCGQGRLFHIQSKMEGWVQKQCWVCAQKMHSWMHS
jgi:hypothetical protein